MDKLLDEMMTDTEWEYFRDECNMGEFDIVMLVEDGELLNLEE